MRDTVWTFRTKRFRVTLEISPSYDQRYDGDDEGGETQAKIDSGEYVMFDSVVRVVYTPTGWELGFDSLGSSVYAEPSEFWAAHRTSPAEYRNTLALKAQNRVICHCFPDMVHIACCEARKAIKELGSIYVRG